MRDTEFAGYTLKKTKEILAGGGYTSVGVELLKAPRAVIEELLDGYRTIYVDYDDNHTATICVVPLI